MTVHPIEPVFNESSRILILGSFPSVKSREVMFYYGHPQNRFWKVLSKIFRSDVPQTVQDKKEFLLGHGIALWDVIKSCEITGSSDSSVKNVTANDISYIFEQAHIEKVYVNGRCAQKYYDKYIYPSNGIKCFALPSTSPANAAYSLERLCDEWSVIREALRVEI